MVGSFNMPAGAGPGRRAPDGGELRGSSPSFALARDQRRPDRPRTFPDSGIRRGPFYRGRAGAGLDVARGPIRLVGLHDQIETSLQERAGGRYAIALGPTYLMHDSWGVGLGFKGLTIRDAAGRTVLSAPGGKVGLNPFALAMPEVEVRRLELDGLDLRLRVAADGALSLAVASDLGATPIPLPGATPAAGGVADLPALVRAAAEAMAGATQAMDRLTLANGHFKVDIDATNRSVVYSDFAVVFDHSGSRAHAVMSATGPAGPWTITAQASDGRAPPSRSTPGTSASPTSRRSSRNLPL